MGDGPLEQAKQVTEVIGGLIQAAGDNPEVKQAGSELGKAALTLAKSVNVVLLPLAAINFGYDKAKEYFSNKDKFEKDFSEKTKHIPYENIVDPKPSLAGPAMQGLAFSHDEPNLKEMYLNLLANAMDKTKASDIHPAFVEIIKQLSSDEVNILNLFLKDLPKHPICEIRISNNEGPKRKYVTSSVHVLNVYDDVTKEPILVEKLDSYVENWIRLGIYGVDYEKQLALDGAYDWVKHRPEYLTATVKEGQKVVSKEGIMELTALGREFAKAIS